MAKKSTQRSRWCIFSGIVTPWINPFPVFSLFIVRTSSLFGLLDTLVGKGTAPKAASGLRRGEGGLDEGSWGNSGRRHAGRRTASRPALKSRLPAVARELNGRVAQTSKPLLHPPGPVSRLVDLPTPRAFPSRFRRNSGKVRISYPLTVAGQRRTLTGLPVSPPGRKRPGGTRRCRWGILTLRPENVKRCPGRPFQGGRSLPSRDAAVRRSPGTRKCNLFDRGLPAVQDLSYL